MIDVHEKLSGKGTPFWQKWNLTSTGRFVFLTCPKGHRAMLDHKIDDGGKVSPSVVCPEDGCGFHEFVRLVGWKS